MHSLVPLSSDVWRVRQAAHQSRADELLRDHVQRASRGERHPVYDFLFDYYSYRPGLLRRWHPGLGFLLLGADAAEYAAFQGYARFGDGIAADPRLLKPTRRAGIEWLLQMLLASRSRPAFFGCYGLHEWAMVYRAGEIRHSAVPLRFSEAEIARIVESMPVCCTHFDAFRFFTPAAVPRNRWQLARETTRDFEQRGCLHANMDLYKWAHKLAPYSQAELVLDAFELARDIRVLDMRASPYDLAAYGFSPVKIETAEGRAEYEAMQRKFSERSEPLRARLIELCEQLLSPETASGRGDSSMMQKACALSSTSV